MKLNICFLLLLCLFFTASAQDKTQILNKGTAGDSLKSGLKNLLSGGIAIGQKVPDVQIEHIENLILNGKNINSARISDFAGKLLILDFWATWCSPCRAMMPRLDSLQKRFGDQLIILPVTYESKAVADPVITQLKKQHPMSLPEVTGDHKLQELFPHKYLPHYVWIGKDGVVKAITEMGQVTPVNIKKMLSANSDETALEEKQEIAIAYDKNKPMFLAENGGDGTAVQFHSMLTGYTPGISGGVNITARDSIRGQLFTARNTTFIRLANLAYNKQGFWFPKSRIEILSRDSARMTTQRTGMAYRKWLAAGNGWSYELLVPPTFTGDPFTLIRQDLARYFPAYQVSVESKIKKSLVLVRTSAVDKLKSTGANYALNISAFSCHIRNGYLLELMLRLNAQYLQNFKLPIADGTGYLGKIDLDLDASLSDIKALNAALAKYDLAFVEKDYPAEILVIRDNIHP